MFTSHIARLQGIFVGRKEELAYLESLWEGTLQSGEHYVHVLLNAPGTGKTRLLKYFGEQLEAREQGLYLHYYCDSRHWTTSSLHASIIKELREVVITRAQLITQFIEQHYQNDEERTYRQERFAELKQLIQQLSSRKEGITLDDAVTALHDLSQIIPIFFVADEIQEFQKAILHVEEPSLLSRQITEETALHYFTRILKSLMRSRILFILSGTQYHVLTQIGFKIGSPIAQKVRPVIIKNFTPEEVDEYADRVHELITQSNLKPHHVDATTMDALLSHYRNFLHAFSGGHPRTVTFITERLLLNLHDFLEMKQPPLTENRFMEMFFALVEDEFKTQLFSREKQAQIRKLQASEQFDVVKEWILTRSHDGFELGFRPKVNDMQNQEEIDRIVFQLMTIGVIVQNGAGKYHVTSYFHLLAFLECFTDEHALLLQRLLQDRLFKLTCGGHAGFGYTFEHVLIAILLTRLYRDSTSTMNGTRDIPLSLGSIQTVQSIKNDVDWDALQLKSTVLYHAPRARAIDLFFLENGKLILIQATTSRHPPSDKIDQLIKEKDRVKKVLPKLHVIGWFISLYPLPMTQDIAESLKNENIIITAGESLKSLIGKTLYERLLQVKDELSSH